MADEITKNAPEGTGAAIDWGVHGVPEIFIVDRGGRIAHKHIGAINAKALEEEIMPLVHQLRLREFG